MHYSRFKKFGDPHRKYQSLPISQQKCSVENCQDIAKEKTSHGIMCDKHAQRIRRYNDPHYKTPEEIRVANNRKAQKNLGRLQSHVYPKLFGRHEHRVVMEQKLGRKLTSKEIVHHIDGNKHNNHPDNLELMTQPEHIRLHRYEMMMAHKKRQAERRQSVPAVEPKEWSE